MCGPVGNNEFVRRLSEERIRKDQHLWRAIVWVPDLQCAWQINPSPVRRPEVSPLFEDVATHSVRVVCQTP